MAFASSVERPRSSATNAVKRHIAQMHGIPGKWHSAESRVLRQVLYPEREISAPTFGIFFVSVRSIRAISLVQISDFRDEVLCMSLNDTSP